MSKKNAPEKKPDELLKELKKNMIAVNWALHFTRNKTKWRTRFYQRFVWIVTNKGTKKWNDVEDWITRPWDAARFDFDQMYGLIFAWKDLKLPISNNSSQSNVPSYYVKLSKQIEDLKVCIKDAAKQVQDNSINMKDATTKIEQSVKDFQSLHTAFRIMNIVKEEKEA